MRRTNSGVISIAFICTSWSTYHFSMAIYAPTQELLSQQIATTRAELSNAGFVSVKEDLAVTAAF